MKTSKILVALMLTIYFFPSYPALWLPSPRLLRWRLIKILPPRRHCEVTGFASKVGSVTLSFLVGGDEVDLETVTAAADGKYQYEYDLPASPERGLWTVKAVDADSKTDETTFIVLNVGTEEIAKELLKIAKGTMTYTEDKLGDELPKAAQENFDAGNKALEEAQASLTMKSIKHQ